MSARPMRPSELAEHTLIDRILSGTWPPGSTLPAERELAGDVGVTRPTLRETLKSLERHGWITIRHGKSSVVNDFWETGGLGILGTLSRYPRFLPVDLARNLLETRRLLLPPCAATAARINPCAIIEMLREDHLPDDNEESVSDFDWQLQREIVKAAKNRIFLLIYNDFQPVFLELGTAYFAPAQTREASFAYYRNLRKTLENNPDLVSQVVENAMAQALTFWDERIAPALAD